MLTLKQELIAVNKDFEKGKLTVMQLRIAEGRIKAFHNVKVKPLKDITKQDTFSYPSPSKAAIEARALRKKSSINRHTHMNQVVSRRKSRIQADKALKLTYDIPLVRRGRLIGTLHIKDGETVGKTYE